MELIRCGHCERSLPIESFNPSQRKNGRWCKDCYQSKYREKVGPPAPPRPCEFCGATIEHPLGQKQKYCGAGCKQKALWKRKHPRDGRTCQACGADISHMRGNAKWCSNACAMKRPSNAAVQRRSRVKNTYGLTLEQVDELLASQNGACAICRSESPKTHHDQWHIDHDHLTGKVRGLLCGNCNTGIGHLQDDPEVIRAALAYVEGHRMD